VCVHESIRNESFIELGARPPNPRNLPLSGQNGCFGSTTIEALERRIGLRRNATRAPTQAPEWRGRLRPPQMEMMARSYTENLIAKMRRDAWLRLAHPMMDGAKRMELAGYFADSSPSARFPKRRLHIEWDQEAKRHNKSQPRIFDPAVFRIRLAARNRAIRISAKYRRPPGMRGIERSNQTR